jgi:hypothetical protein
MDRLGGYLEWLKEGSTTVSGGFNSYIVINHNFIGYQTPTMHHTHDYTKSAFSARAFQPGQAL